MKLKTILILLKSFVLRSLLVPKNWSILIKKLSPFSTIKSLQVIIHLIPIFVQGIFLSNYYSWRPNVDFDGAPIPTRFDYEDNRIHILLDRTKNSIVYYGFRAQDSLNLHEFLSTKSNYPFQFPSRSVYMLTLLNMYKFNVSFSVLR